jgi:hypothetical protein
MSDHDHGPYTPPSDRLSFDPREPVRGGGPAPVTLIVSGVVLLAIIGGVFLLYRGGIRHKGDTPAAVGAPLGQIKTPAAPDANAAGPRLVIDRSDVTNSATNAAPTFAPQAEQPLPRPLPVKPVEITALPPASAPPVKAPTPPPSRIAVQSAAKPAKPLTIASLADAALAQKSPPKPAPKPVAAAPAVLATTSTAAPSAGAGWVQIGAYSSAELAEKGWSDAAKLEPGAMAGKGQRVESVSVGGKTLYRAYVTGFTHDGAESFCGQLKAAGKACFVK